MYPEIRNDSRKKEIFGEQKGAHGNEIFKGKVPDTSQKRGSKQWSSRHFIGLSKWLNIQIIGVLRQENKKAVERNSSKEFKTSPKVNNRICQIKCVH